jgi:hypothetical protein
MGNLNLQLPDRPQHQTNVKSLYKTIHYYESLNLANCTDIFSVSETWLKPELPVQMISLLGFNLLRCDRKSATKTRGGGAAIYVNSKFNLTKLSQQQKKLDNCVTQSGLI